MNKNPLSQQKTEVRVRWVLLRLLSTYEESGLKLSFQIGLLPFNMQN